MVVNEISLIFLRSNFKHQYVL